MIAQKSILTLLFVSYLSAQINGNRVKRMYALCPPNFFRIGNECYFISKDRVNWLDAHFECKDRNSRLAEPFKQEDKFLRKYLNNLRGPKYSDIWIGGLFNWERNKWQWGYNGKDVTYQSFSQLSGDRKDLKNHCAILKPELKYRWYASSCVEDHLYICQHRMPYVSAKNRQKVYNKWNETYPNELANEIEVVLSEDDLLRHRQRMQRIHRNNRPNLRQVKTEQNRRRENVLPFNDLSQSKHRPIYRNPPRGNGSGDDRLQNEINRFNLKLNRNQASGIRRPIQFNTSNAAKQNRDWRRKHRLTTTTTTTTTTTMAPMTTTLPPPPSPPTHYWTPVSVTNEYTPSLTDEQILFKRQEEEDRLRYESQQRRILEEQNNLRRLEEQRIKEENEMREKHLHEMQRRREELLMEEQKLIENERIREEKKHQNEMRNLQNEQNRQRIEVEEERRQQELIRQRDEQTNNHQNEIQTNEIFDRMPTTTTESPQSKRERRRKIHEKLKNLTPEQREAFYKKRAERNKKRGIEKQEIAT